MRRRVLTALAFTVLAYATILAQETPRWLRQSALSPDGKTVAFCYQGDIFTVSANGGEARQITSSSYYESDPVWSTDGKQLIFSSFREGSKDVWAARADGR